MNRLFLLIRKILRPVPVRIVLILTGTLLVIRLCFLLVPYPELETFQKSRFSTVIRDRNGLLLQILPLENGMRREYLPVEKIKPQVKKIFLKSEDRRFYLHFGVDPVSMVRSVFLNVRSGKIVSGGSTITMQLARLVSPRGSGYTGKLMEILNAFRIEARLGKKEILELYLNSIPYSYNVTGVQSASRKFFNEELNGLPPAAVIALSVIPRNPSRYHPALKNPELVDRIERIARSIGLDLTPLQIQRELGSAGFYDPVYQAQHFVRFLQKSGMNPSEREVKSSLDLTLNRYAENRLGDIIASYENFRLTNGAVIIINNRNGEILAYVGSRDFNDKSNQGEIDGVQTLNQPGSAIKPFLYAYGLEKGMLPNLILPDIPQDFGGERVYIPLNFNKRYNGPVRFRIALASSLNIPSVYLVTRLGVSGFVKRLIDLDFESLRGRENQLGAGVAVGNCSVSLYELVRAFSAFSRNGERNRLTGMVTGVTSVPGGRLYSAYTAAVMADILGDSRSRILGFGNTRQFETDFPALFKTGTSNQFNNLWALGSSRHFTVGVWMGNFTGETVIGRTGSSLPLKLAVELLKYVNGNNRDELTDLKAYQKVRICTLSGRKAGMYCSSSVSEYFPPGTEVEECLWHRGDSGRVVIELPTLYKEWASKKVNVQFLEEQNQYFKPVEILTPKDGSVFFYDPSIPSGDQAIRFEVYSVSDKEKVDVRVNGRFFKTLSDPYRFFLPVIRGEYDVEVRGARGNDRIRFTVK